GTITGRVDVPTSNKSILGLPGAKIVGGIDITGSSSKRLSNIIVRNLQVQGPGSNDVDGVDCIAIQYVSNVWIDHLDVYDGQDGNMDITNEADLITVTWVKWHYEKGGNHRFCNLIGSSDSKTGDRGKLNVTFQYCWWTNGVIERMPRVRFGKVHVVNNLFDSKDGSYCVRAGVEADILVQSNAFIGVKNPLDYNGKQSAVTAVTMKDNLLTNCTGTTTGYKTSFTPPYSLSIVSASQVESKVKAGAGATLTWGSAPVTQYTLSATVAQGQGTITPSSGSYAEGSSVTVKASPATGYKFDHWAGAATGTTPEISIVMNGNKTLSAYFVQDGGTVTNYNVSVTSGTGGKVTQNPAGTSLPANSSVTFTAVPDAGYKFTEWSGDLTGTNPSISVTVTKNISAIAKFTQAGTDIPIQITGKVIFVSPDGKADAAGTISAPTTLPVAIGKIGAGDTIYMRGGTYSFDSTVMIDRTNSGSEGKMKVIKAFGNEKPVLDFSKEPYTSNTATNGRGIQINGSYWYLYGLDVYRAADNGIFVAGNHNVIDRCILRKNRDSGLQISRYASSATKEEWPSYNLILNCESYDNYDEPPCGGENADGFACKLTAGPGNVFRGCYSHNNIDDGWDLYTKGATGPISPVVIDRCIASDNGILTDGTTNESGDRNGFKLGGEDIPVAHVVTRCVAFGNGKNGFTWNSNPGAITLANCLAFDNAEGNFKFGDNSTMTEAVFTNNVSFWTDLSADMTDKHQGTDVSNSNCWWDKSKSQQSINGKGLIVTAADFAAPLKNIVIKRGSSGALDYTPFKLSAGSDLINAGILPSGTLPFTSNDYYIGVPDLGAVEFGSDAVTVQKKITVRDRRDFALTNMKLHFFAPANGKLQVMVTKLNGAGIMSLLNASVTAGEHSIPVNTNGMASGIYVVTARVDGECVGVCKFVRR
ncbi:MAG: hypothetical protein GX640_06395, partial [Fibrobacter sp.]|nr:hypothetical protein [Fibrobacter sp.]